MISDLKRYVEFLCQHKITPNQYLFCILSYNFKPQLFKMLKDKKLSITIEELEDLKKKGIILYPSIEDLNFNSIVVTGEFIEYIVSNPYEIAKEIWEIYPRQIEFSNGKYVSSRTITFEDFVEQYKNFLSDDLQLHHKIKNTISKQFENKKYADTGINKYIFNKEYELYEGGSSGDLITNL